MSGWRVRAGWRALIYSLLLAGMTIAEILLLEWIRPPWLRPEPRMTVGYEAINEALLLVPVFMATAVMAGFERRSVFSYGLAGPKPLRNLSNGLLCGIAALSFLILLLLGGGLAQTHWRGLSVLGILGQALAWLGVSWLIGLTEEMAFRGYLLQTLARGMGFWPAALVTSLLFASLHITNADETVIGIINVFGAGMILCLALKRSFSLWWSIGFHAGWDYSENFIYGTHDSGQACAGALLNTLPHGPLWFSGGLAGPEGSLLGLGVEVLAAAGIYVFLRPQARKTPGAAS